MQGLTEPAGKQRIQSIDILRGAIMLIMAIDHCRDFFHNAGPVSDPENLATTTPFLFFTRYITHYCAPNFVFLSGISAYLAGTRRTSAQLSSFLIKRGLWLVFVEMAFMSLALTFNPFYNVFVWQVIWAIGVSMILLGLLVRAPLTVIGFMGVLIVFGHDILDYLTIPQSGLGGSLIRIFFTARANMIQLNANHFIFDLYAITPWTGIMLIGYAYGSFYKKGYDANKRRKQLLSWGLASVAFFIIFRFINHYGDPQPWTIQKNSVYTVLSFFRVSKYPPSLLYTTMTVGVGLIVLSLVENVQNRFTRILTTYGNVPFFYYILHFYLIHTICVILFFATGYHINQISDPQSPFLFRPSTFGFNPGIVYLLWFVVIATLYLPCRWFGKYKKTHSQWWLSYL